MIIRLLLVTCFVYSGALFAQEDCAEHSTRNTADHLMMHARGCPNDHLINALCAHVDVHQLESEGAAHRYRYQTIILNASCVNPTDSKEVIKRKVNTFWNKYADRLTCWNTSFGVQDGSLIKFAVRKNYDAFMVDVTRNWGVDLNRVDPSDQRTVLDFVYDEIAIEERRGSSLVNRLRTYAQLLRNHGAKRKSEL